MNKAQFIEKLTALLSAQTEAERAQLIAYYTEMIDDRIEAGMTEEDAVAALGDPEALTREFQTNRGEITPLPKTTDAGAKYVDELREVRVHMKGANATIRREPLANGAAAQMQFSDPDAFEYRTEGGVLEITEKPDQRRGLLGLDISINGIGFLQKNRSFTLILGEPIPDQLIFDSHGGDMTVTDVVTTDQMVLSTSSGDIKLTHCTCGRRAEITSRSGDVEGDTLEVRGDMKVESLSGDVTLRQIQAKNLRARTASGDVEIARSTSNTLTVSAASGDLRLNDNEAELIACETSSGDVDLARPQSLMVQLNTSSGDITAQLINRAGGYKLDAKTRSGDISLPKHWTPPEGQAAKAQVTAHTVAGDIKVNILK